MSPIHPSLPRVCAVSFLNTTPLVWGMLHGDQRGLFDLEFRTPAVCADELASGAADIGIVPSFELTRQNLQIIRGCGIACHGAVRSILLVSRRPAAEIRTLAVDINSRTSVQLARVVLDRRYRCYPTLIPHAPDLDSMLALADGALIIGDAALRLEPSTLPYSVYDLGAEWHELTGLPMVFAVWAGRAETATAATEQAFRESYRYGREHMNDIVAAESPARGFPPGLVHEYLTRYIVHELGAPEYEGMERFLSYARELDGARQPVGAGPVQPPV